MTDTERTELTLLQYDEGQVSPNVSSLPQEWQRRRSHCEVWTRVMGYHRPYASFNEGKKSEFRERKYFRNAADGLLHS